MNLKLLAQHFDTQLKDFYDQDEIGSIFNIVVAEVSGWRQSQQVLKSQEEIPETKMRAYDDILQALKRAEPLQYILGTAPFYGLDFKVNRSVLIPRPETEELVEWVIESCDSNRELHLIDIGTGSGCIAVSLAKNLIAARVTALDVSASALEVAAYNAAVNEVNISFVEADIRAVELKEKFDIIVSNPPYITNAEKMEMHENVLAHEPHLALFVSNENPLVFYKAIADFALRSLNREGYLFFEINEFLAKEMVDMLESKSFKDIELRTDMQGKDRMIRCRLD